MGRFLIAAASSLLVACLALPAGAADSVASGRHIAGLVCSPCHVVAKDQEFAPLLNTPTPSFEDIANRPGTSAESLRGFLSGTHWDDKAIPMSMPNPMLAEYQRAAVISYILSLRKRP